LARFNGGPAGVGRELVINVFITAGESEVHSAGLAVHPGRPTVCVSSRPLDDRSCAAQYAQGLALSVPSVRHIPAAIIDPHIKYRSRLHWYLADQESRRIDPGSEALLLDLDGYVTETSRGNIFGVFQNELKTPSAATTLAGVSQEVVLELAGPLGLRASRSNMTVEEIASADEILLSSTTACLVPVTRLNQAPVGSGKPGPIWRRLIDAWSASVGVDIVQQALSAQ
jgi:branched-subunit amino acid aminotransferase/4-amino-4-deoxychorismate lyase